MVIYFEFSATKNTRFHADIIIYNSYSEKPRNFMNQLNRNYTFLLLFWYFADYIDRYKAYLFYFIERKDSTLRERVQLSRCLVSSLSDFEPLSFDEYLLRNLSRYLLSTGFPREARICWKLTSSSLLIINTHSKLYQNPRYRPQNLRAL